MIELLPHELPERRRLDRLQPLVVQPVPGMLMPTSSAQKSAQSCLAPRLHRAGTGIRSR